MQIGEEPPFLFSIERDITERKVMEEALRLTSVVFENSSQAMVITDANAVILNVNPAFTQVTGYEPSEAIGKNTNLLKSNRHNKVFYEKMWDALQKTGHWEGEIWNRRKNGDIYPERLIINTVYKADGSPGRRIGQFYDITEQKKNEERIRKMATTDQLTGLGNRYSFYHNLNENISLANRTNNKFAILLIDLDNFKPVNDTYGHHVGDITLRKVAEVLTSSIRETDMAARLGGDEFAIIYTLFEKIPNLEASSMKIINAISNIRNIENHEIHIGASIGISIYPDNGAGKEELLQKADRALYKAKNAGRGTYLIYNEE